MKVSRWWRIAGAVAIIAGIAALIFPFFASLVAGQFAAFAFVAIGVLSLLSAFGSSGWGNRLGSVLWGVLMLLAGLYLIVRPFAGLMSLTIAVGVLFAVSGVARIIFGFSLKGVARHWLVALTGLVSLGLGIFILASLPEAAVVTLGILLGIELIVNGIALLTVSGARDPGAAILPGRGPL